jgi:heat shock protein HslJ
MRHLIVLVAGALMQVACASGPAPVPLRGTTWVLADAGGGAGAQAPYLTLDPVQQQLIGQAQCNRLMGHFTLAADQIGFAQVASTRRACIPDDGSEQRFLQALAEVKRYRIERNELLLFGEGSTPLLRMKAGKAP